MAPTELANEELVRSQLLTGVNRLVDTVRSTLGPRGRNIAIEASSGPPIMTNRGSAVAGQIVLLNSLENIGARLIQDAASRTTREVGDGTTSALLLAQSLLEQSVKVLAAGASAMLLFQEIQQAVQTVTEELESFSEPLTPDLAPYIAMNAAQDPVVGQYVASVLSRTASEIIDITETEYPELSSETTLGMKLNAGFVSSQFAPAESPQEVALRNPYILVAASAIRNTSDIQPVMERVSVTKRPLLLITPEVSGEALRMLLLNHKRETLRSVCVNVPGMTEEHTDTLEDIAALTGATVIRVEAGARMSEVSLDQLGGAGFVTVTSRSTVIREGRGTHQEVERSIARIESRQNSSKTPEQRTNLEKRIVSLRGRSIVIKVGGATDLEKQDRRTKVERAVSALRAAEGEGVVAGGGVALLRAGDFLQVTPPRQRTLGTRVVGIACEAIVRQLARNSGYDGASVVARIRESNNLGFGFNVESDVFEDLLNSGIVDPLSVVISSLRNAASVALLILSAGAAIYEKNTRPETALERKYRGKSDYIMRKDLAWPPASSSTGQVNAFVKLDDGVEPTVSVGQRLLFHAGLERDLNGTNTSPTEHQAGDEIPFSITVSAPGVSRASGHYQEIVLKSGSPSVSADFIIVFEEAGIHALLIEFYCRRVWLGQISVDIEVHPVAILNQVNEFTI
jgi:chaperonin GroEL